MRSPAGWLEPGQRPDFANMPSVMFDAVLVPGGEWVRYSTPDGASYIAVCLPAFAPDTVHRDDG